MTTTLKIEHAIIDFETWKAAFERDPIGRQQAGVRRYRIYRPLDDPKYVMLDLDFDSSGEAEAFLRGLQRVWSRVDLSPGLARTTGAGSVTPRARIVQELETHSYSGT
ncbi:MAG TPA: hypothetical protein VI072_22815 [Polyangiaceae bacterium]